MTTFKPHPNNVSTCLAAPYTAGSGALVLEAGTGVKFGTVFPLTVTVIRAATYGTPDEFSVLFNVTARTGDTLTISGAIEGTTDHDFVVEDRVDVRWTDGLAKAVEGAVNALETTVVYTTGSYADPAWITSLAGSKVTGNISGSAATITGSITTSQVSNLSSWPGSTAITTLGTIATGTWQGAVIAPARLGTGAPGTNPTTWLRGDGLWAFLVGVSSVNSNVTLAVPPTFYSVNATAGNILITLPTIASAVGLELILHRADSSANTVTIQRQGTDTFLGGGTSVTLPTVNKYIRLIAHSPSAIWFIVGQN